MTSHVSGAKAPLARWLLALQKDSPTYIQYKRNCTSGYLHRLSLSEHSKKRPRSQHTYQTMVPYIQRWQDLRNDAAV